MRLLSSSSLRILNYMEENGAECFERYDINPTPNPGTDEYDTMMRLCGSCPVSLHCAVYSLAEGAAAVNGSNISTNRGQANTILSDKALFTLFLDGLQ